MVSGLRFIARAQSADECPCASMRNTSNSRALNAARRCASRSERSERGERGERGERSVAIARLGNDNHIAGLLEQTWVAGARDPMIVCEQHDHMPALDAGAIPGGGNGARKAERRDSDPKSLRQRDGGTARPVVGGVTSECVSIMKERTMRRA